MIENYLRELAKYLDFRFPTKKFSEDLGYSKATVNQYLNNNAQISDKFIQKLEEVYNINYRNFVAQMTQSTKEPSATYDVVKPDSIKETQLLIKGFKRVIAKAQEEIKLLESQKQTPQIAETITEWQKLIYKVKKDIAEYKKYL
jgi:transcriptional regulator with XRE-family HTH domain